MSSVISPAKLYKAMDASDRKDRNIRALRDRAFREFLGRYYNEDDGIERPINIVYRACKVYQAHIAFKSPTYDVGTEDPMVRGEATTLGTLISELARELRFSQLDRLLLLDAMLSPRAVVRMGLRVGSELVTIEGRDLDPGRWYLRRVSLDNHLTDPRARSKEELAWEGDRYRVNRNALLESGVFDNAVIERLPILPMRAGQSRHSRVEDISSANTSDRFDLIETVELVDCFFYDPSGSGETVKVTLPAQYVADDWLREEGYQGPDRGPYEWLEFDPIPDNLAALPPVAGYREQSENVNKVIAKALEQIAKSKRIGIAGDQMADDEIDGIADAQDGDIERVANPEQFKVAEFGFLDPSLFPIGQMLLSFANAQAGNIDMLGGAGADTDKATIFQGLMSTAGAMTDLMVTTHDDFWTAVGRHALWNLVHDPLIQKGTLERIPGGWDVGVQYTADQRHGRFEQMRCKVKPRSTVRVDANVKAAQLMKLGSVVPGLIQTEMVSRGAFNSFGFLQVLAENLGVDELDRFIRDPMVLQQMAMKYQWLAPFAGQGQPGNGPAPALPGINLGADNARAIDAGRSARTSGMAAPIPQGA